MVGWLMLFKTAALQCALHHLHVPVFLDEGTQIRKVS